MRRVVSLVPSITKTLRAWGLDPIACTRFCEQPDLPTVGGTKNPDIEAIAALAPDVVALDREENRREDAEALIAAGLTVVALDVRCLDDLDEQMRMLAHSVGCPPPAPIVVPSPSTSPSPSIERQAFVPIWRRPWMTIGHETYGTAVLGRLGIGNVFADTTSAYPEVTLDEVAARRPDLIVVPSEPNEFRPEAPRRARRHRSGGGRRRAGPVLVGSPHTGRADPARRSSTSSAASGSPPSVGDGRAVRRSRVKPRCAGPLMWSPWRGLCPSHHSAIGPGSCCIVVA